MSPVKKAVRNSNRFVILSLTKYDYFENHIMMILFFGITVPNTFTRNHVWLSTLQTRVQATQFKCNRQFHFLFLQKYTKIQECRIMNQRKKVLYDNLPNPLINSVKTPGSLSIRHQSPAVLAMLLNALRWRD